MTKKKDPVVRVAAGTFIVEQIVVIGIMIRFLMQHYLVYSEMSGADVYINVAEDLRGPMVAVGIDVLSLIALIILIVWRRKKRA